MTENGPRVLVTGATGYVGGRLLAALEAAAGPWRLRCLARQPQSLRGRAAATTEVVRGDCFDPPSLAAALHDVDAAFYLVHSMGGGAEFAQRDLEAAETFARAASAAGVRRIVYLGGLGVSGDGLSTHLRSRQATGARLASTGVPVIELRASVIIGSGSLSFELVRSLVERLPVMICPRWVSVLTQPIAIEDVLAYLRAALDLPAGVSGVFEIGGPDVVSYGDLMRELARQRRLRRILLPVPVLTPRLSSLWLGLVTPLYARVGRQLIEGLRNPTVVRSDRALRTFGLRPRPLREAIARALQQEGAPVPATRWTDARSSSALHPRPWGSRRRRRVLYSRTREVAATPARAFAPITRIGGEQGWYWGNALWRLRGFIDLLAGGVGMRRGRPHPHRLTVGDAVDWWRVDALVPDRLLCLSAEMRLPGRAWLEFVVEPRADGHCAIRQTAIFEPSGPGGWAYWIALYPMHALIFEGMFRAIARQAAPPTARPFLPIRTRVHPQNPAA